MTALFMPYLTPSLLFAVILDVWPLGTYSNCCWVRFCQKHQIKDKGFYSILLCICWCLVSSYTAERFTNVIWAVVTDNRRRSFYYKGFQAWVVTRVSNLWCMNESRNTVAMRWKTAYQNNSNKILSICFALSKEKDMLCQPSFLAWPKSWLEMAVH